MGEGFMQQALVGMVLVVMLCAGLSGQTQQSVATNASPVVPTLVKFSGTLTDVSGQALTGIVGVTIYLYKDEQGGAPLLMETQNVRSDKNGHYSVVLGTTTAQGLPTDLFASGEARWLGVQAQGQAEQPRVLLLSVPYALKAGDAQTVGGLPPSAFVLAAPAVGNATTTTASTAAASSSASAPPPASSNVTTTGGTANTIPVFTTATNIQNSLLTQAGTTAINVGGTLNLPASGTATALAGFKSRPHNFVASVFNSGTSTAVAQTFQLQAEPVNNNTTTASGTLNLLYATGTATPAETGLKVSSKGLFTFATGQTFPGAGTVKSVGLAAPATDFTVTGSPVTSTGTLNIAWKVTPTSADTANAIVKRDGSGNFTAGTVTATSLNAANATLTNSLNINSTTVTPLFVQSNVGSATVITGDASATTGGAWGVEGITQSNASDARGVYGLADSATGSPNGVYGLASSNFGVGVFGQLGSESSTGINFTGFGVGTWGDAGAGTGAWGVLGTADDSIAGIFQNNSASAGTLYAQNSNASGRPFFAFNTANNTFCDVDSGGNLNCTGSKNAVVPIDSGKRIVAMSAIESPKNWFEDFGSAQLSGGSAVVAIDPEFAQTVNAEMNYMVIPVPNGECKGLFVTNKTPTSFEVRELGGGTSNIQFDYRIVALRKNYESVRFADHTNDPDPRKMMERMKSVRPQARPALANKVAPLHPALSQGTGK
jgi:hypothetical protein